MNIWDRFDFKALISYAGYEEVRHNKAMLELERVGITDVVPFWNAKTPADELLLTVAPHVRMLEAPGMFNSTLGHYRVIKAAYQLGVDNLLVMEDDVRFMKDADTLEKIVCGMPKDYDLALLDWWHRAKASEEEWAGLAAAPVAVPYWKRFTNLRSAACYAMSRKGMICFIDLVEGAIRGMSGYKLRITDQFWPHIAGKGLNCYCAWPNAAVQGYCEGRALSDRHAIWARYARYCIERSDYAD